MQTDRESVMEATRIRLEESWKSELLYEFSKPYMQDLKKTISEQKASGKIVYPLGKQWFAALNHTPLKQVRVVIIGQDPYHGPGQAHGMCFSVPSGVAEPPSLCNIFKEITADLGSEGGRFQRGHGDLTPWAKQGVLLLNAVLTVVRHQAGSHQGLGWELFTDRIVEILDQHCQHLVFMLWGSYAQRKGERIDQRRHLVLKASHPSPLSAHRGFLGCRHFSRCNQYLIQHGYPSIDWFRVN